MKKIIFLFAVCVIYMFLIEYIFNYDVRLLDMVLGIIWVTICGFVLLKGKYE